MQTPRRISAEQLCRLRGGNEFVPYDWQFAVHARVNRGVNFVFSFEDRLQDRNSACR